MKDFFKSVFKLTGIMLLILGIIFGAAILWLNINGKSLDFNDINPFENKEKRETKNVLVAALHTEGPLTDFIMVVQYNPETKRAVALSIPRDTKVIGTIDGKINSAYAKKKNINDLIDKVEEVTSLSIDNYVLLETNVVAEMVDAIGGITYDVPIAMDYDDNSQNLHIKISKGKQTLDGEKTVKFLRFRKNNDGTGYARGDIQRIEVQQDFIKEAVAQVLVPKTILKLPELIKLGLSLVKTDLTLEEIIGYVDEVSDFNMENLRMEILPGEGKYIGPTSYYVADNEKTIKLINEMFYNETPGVQNSTETLSSNTAEKTEEEIKKENLTIEVLNATSKNGLAAKVAEILKEEGYNVTKTGNYKTTENKKTTIINRCDDNTFSKDIKKILDKGNITTEDKSSSDTDITVIVGSDY